MFNAVKKKKEEESSLSCLGTVCVHVHVLACVCHYPPHYGETKVLSRVIPVTIFPTTVPL